jgi:hypothetical protein
MEIMAEFDVYCYGQNTSYGKDAGKTKHYNSLCCVQFEYELLIVHYCRKYKAAKKPSLKIREP